MAILFIFIFLFSFFFFFTGLPLTCFYTVGKATNGATLKRLTEPSLWSGGGKLVASSVLRSTHRGRGQDGKSRVDFPRFYIPLAVSAASAASAVPAPVSCLEFPAGITCRKSDVPPARRGRGTVARQRTAESAVHQY